MSSNYTFSKENLDECLKELGKEYRKRSGKNIPAEIVLIGGASVLINYDFREMTDDADAIIEATSVMKEAINIVQDKLRLPNKWLNTDFMKTDSYSYKLQEVSKYYKQFSNVLTVRTVDSEYLIAMKLMSGRIYKYDLSDIAGILMEHKKQGTPISKKKIEDAVSYLYNEPLPEKSIEFLNGIFNRDYEQVYLELRKLEAENKEILLQIHDDYPGLINRDNISEIIEKAREKLNN